MMIFAMTFGVLMTLIAMMSVGVVFSGKRLKGSCGGVGGSCACDEAGRPRACEVPSDPAAGAVATLPSGAQVGHSRPGSVSQTIDECL